ncbi:taurine catabolism dioxygenase TauD, TfdA family-domain-containing protein [Fusarium tricinctum]|uniref:Taurine catabolism dioxygenase TauD, TfdA family-domain-containing protein n=1 Tax=Fusarium tricinctum TaxID=61284 RepID=A0A8K0W6A3_9HYPO|nr:taurine catabolism dioxygenase TauD, TfdA family-domain-containing protein [Fusarium tricinctum]
MHAVTRLSKTWVIQPRLGTAQRLLSTSHGLFKKRIIANQRATAKKPSRTPITVDGKTLEFSSILLRDSCQCPSCVHESSNQRLFSAADIPANIQARSIEVDSASESVNIKWENDAPGFGEDHTTQLSVAALRELDQSGSLPDLQDFDYNEYMQDDREVYKLIHQLRTDGLALVTNVPGKVESLATIATRIGPVQDTFYGHTWDVWTVPQAINAAYTSADLGFHTDLLYFQNPPHVQLLHCVQSASTGGASVFADAYKSAVDLYHSDPKAFETLATIPVNYHYNHPNDNVYRTTKTVIDLRPLRIGDKDYTNVHEYANDYHKVSLKEKTNLTLDTSSRALCDLAVAHELENELLSMDFDTIVLLEEVQGFLVDTRDDNTPVSHLLQTAEAYRKAGLLQLYLIFDDLVVNTTGGRPGSTGTDNSTDEESRAKCLVDLALQLTNTLEKIPVASGSKFIHPMLYLSAAVGLRFNKHSDFYGPGIAEGVRDDAELNDIHPAVYLESRKGETSSMVKTQHDSTGFAI